jgi:hypothetical protein
MAGQGNNDLDTPTPEQPADINNPDQASQGGSDVVQGLDDVSKDLNELEDMVK